MTKSRIPFIKKWLSYISPQHVQSLASSKHDNVDIFVDKGRLQLSTANAIYSFDDLYDNFGNLFKKINWERIPGDNALVLGMGLGSIPFILEKVENKKFYYTAIEYDEAIIQLCSEMTLPYLESSIQVINADALEYIYYCMDSFDIICIDIFHDDQIPEEARETAFLEQIKELMNSNALVIFNWLYLNQDDKSKAENYFENIFKAQFPNADFYISQGNILFVNDKLFIK